MWGRAPRQCHPALNPPMSLQSGVHSSRRPLVLDKHDEREVSACLYEPKMSDETTGWEVVIDESWSRASA